MNHTRKITVSISATGRGLQKESFSFSTREMSNEEALNFYKELTTAVNGVVFKPKNFAVATGLKP